MDIRDWSAILEDQIVSSVKQIRRKQRWNLLGVDHALSACLHYLLLIPGPWLSKLRLDQLSFTCSEIQHIPEASVGMKCSP